jgi:ATP-binding cassette subfamily B protein RaxB
VLHWDFSHFVVLTGVQGDRVTLHDPAAGERELALAEFSKHFTGVALELMPASEFTPRDDTRKVKLTTLIGRLQGLGGTVTQILVLALVLQLFAILAPFYMQWIVDQALVAQDYDLITVLGIGFLLLRRSASRCDSIARLGADGAGNDAQFADDHEPVSSFDPPANELV